MRCFEGDFGRELKKFIQKRFTVVKNGAELQPRCAVRQNFSACEEEEYDVNLAVYNICRDDGAILKVGRSHKDYTPFGIELSCVKMGKKD